MKPDSQEHVLQFDGIESTTLYVLRFEAFERNFSTPKKRLVVRKIMEKDVDVASVTTDNNDDADDMVVKTVASKKTKY